MTPVETLRGQKVAVFGLGGLGPVDGARAGRRRRRSRGLGRQRGARASAPPPAGFALVDLAEADWRALQAARARRPACR